MKTSKNTIFLGLVILTAVLVFMFTNPQSSPAAVLIIPFILLFLIIFILSKMVLRRNFKSLTGKKNRKRSATAAILAILPVALLALQSVGQLTVRDTITLVLIVVVVGFYISRFSFKKDRQA